MSIKVRYFASLKESVGRPEDHLPFTHALAVHEVWTAANPGLALPETILAAVNMEYVSFDSAVQDGDEVAFFPPVTGG
ncbi:MAG: molybdopterin converting factor subunit 1 [Methylococcales bacterium]|nr:molybdopterin converting factor subunit 1 [Methylococcales bacterium]